MKGRRAAARFEVDESPVRTGARPARHEANSTEITTRDGRLGLSHGPSPATTRGATLRRMARERDPRQPKPLSSQVSAQLSRMPVKNTGPEVRLRRSMHALGLRFRINASLPGRPDIVLPSAKIAIFVDGCFWHACPEHGVLPKNNQEWWATKLARTVERDREKDGELRALGWHVIHVWEHEDPATAAAAIRARWRSRLAREPDGLVSVPRGNLVQDEKSGGPSGDEAVHG